MDNSTLISPLTLGKPCPQVQLQNDDKTQRCKKYCFAFSIAITANISLDTAAYYLLRYLVKRDVISDKYLLHIHVSFIAAIYLTTAAVLYYLHKSKEDQRRPRSRSIFISKYSPLSNSNQRVKNYGTKSRSKSTFTLLENEKHNPGRKRSNSLP